MDGLPFSATIAIHATHPDRPPPAMALIACPECAKQVSDQAPACPGCGFPIARGQAEGIARTGGGASPALIAEMRPSRWLWFWHWFFFWLILPPIIAWWQRGAVVLRIYPDRLVLERGRMGKSTRELLIRDIRTIEIDETFFGRLFGYGDLTIATAASADGTEFIQGIRDPRKVRDTILAIRSAN